MTDREKLIDVFMNLDDHISNRDEYGVCFTSDFVKAVEKVLEMLKSQDTNGVVISKNETTTQQWIPVTERLPEENDYYLCCVKSFVHYGRCYINILEFYKDGFKEGHIYTDSVTHWMPMPEPPKGD